MRKSEQPTACPPVERNRKVQRVEETFSVRAASAPDRVRQLDPKGVALVPKRPCAVFAIASWAQDGVFPPDVVTELRRFVVLDPGRTLVTFDGDAATTTLADAELLLTGWGCPRIDDEVLDRAPRLRAVIHAAGSVKSVVDPVAFDRGVTVSSAAAANAVPVAEYTVATLILAAKRAITRARWYADASLPDSDRRWLSGAGTGLYDCTVGVVGASHIGRLVLRRLRGHDVRVLLTDPYVSTDEARGLGAELVELDELCRRSELITLHAPALPETYHLLDARRLDLLPEGATVVNTARGALVDTAALTRHCVSGRLSAVLDVTDPEPLPRDHELLRLPNVLVTPHLAGAQGRELRRLGEFAAAEVARLLHGEPLRGLIRATDLDHIA